MKEGNTAMGTSLFRLDIKPISKYGLPDSDQNAGQFSGR